MTSVKMASYVVSSPVERDISLTILKARIALLATAIGGPDYTSHLEPPPYKLGDDCLACLRDLKKWFRLVDDQQNRWDVAMAAAEYHILVDDLLPILIDWENKCSLTVKLSKKNKPQAKEGGALKNKEYHDNIALSCLQLMVLMTRPLILTDQSTSNQVAIYSDLKKYQLTYKKSILSLEKGKALKAAIRLALKVIKIQKLDRTPRDNMIIGLVLSFFRNIIAIEPGELNITTKKQSSSRGVNSVDMLPPNVSMDDISLNTVITALQHNKVFGLLLTLSSSTSHEFDHDFTNIPLMEVIFYITKDISQQALFLNHAQGNKSHQSSFKDCSATGSQLSALLEQERKLKKDVIKNTSSRHSRFGALLSIQTADNVRLTVSGGQNLLNENSALKKLDSRKKWNKRTIQKRDDVVIEGLPNSLLNSESKSAYFHKSVIECFTNFIEDFIDLGFNSLLHRLTNHFTTEQDQMAILEQIEYLLFFAWFIEYQRERCKRDSTADIDHVSVALKETSFILVSSLLRKGYDDKNWVVAHAGMIAFNKLLLLVDFTQSIKPNDDIEFILSRLFSDDRIQLLSNLPKTALRHSLQYIKSCVELTHTALKIFENHSDDRSLMISKKIKKPNTNEISEHDITSLMESQEVERDEAIEMLLPVFREIQVNFTKVQSAYMNESVIDSYISFLQRFRELDDEYIKKALAFLHRIFVHASEETLLFRIDLILLLRDMLAADGIQRNSRVRKHVEEFSNYYLYKLKKKLKASPSWIVGLLFPLLHDSEVGFFQKYGETKVIKHSSFYAAPPSRFKSIPDEKQLPESYLKDVKYGILVSALLDDGKNEILNQLADHMQSALDNFQSWLTVNVNHQTETVNPPKEFFKIEQSMELDPVIYDKDFRALLKQIGYDLPGTIKEPCYLPGTVEIPILKEALELVRKYLSIPFQTPNGLPSSSYLIRPSMKHSSGIEEDGWGGDEDYHAPDIVGDNDDNSNDDNSYFNDLEGQMVEKLQGRKISKGLAKAKKTKKKGKGKRTVKTVLPTHHVEQTEDVVRKERPVVSSKEFISDSEDENDLMSPVFFENEMYMRFLLDKYNGQLPDEKYAQFGKFAAERMACDGATKSDFSDLFGGAVPDIANLNHLDTQSVAPDRTLFSLSDRVAAEIEAALNKDITDATSESLAEIDENILENDISCSSPASSSSVTPVDHGQIITINTLEQSNKRSKGDSTSEKEDELQEDLFIFKKRSKIIVEEEEE